MKGGREERRRGREKEGRKGEGEREKRRVGHKC